MTDAAAESTEGASKPGRKPLIIGLVLALLGAGGGFFAVSSGTLPIGSKGDVAKKDAGAPEEAVMIERKPDDLSKIAFVPIEPIIVSLNHDANVKHLRFRAQLEVEADHAGEVEQLLPRVTDVLNSYLRAIDFEDFSDSLELVRLRAQMLRRVQIVTGKGRVRDLLIMEFVLN